MSAVDLPSFFGTYFFWFPDFARSSGFAGVFAVVAATIAYLAATRNSRRERWWKRAEFALNLVLSEKETVQVVGLIMLDTLKSSDRQEQDFVKAATDVFLDPNVDGDTADDAVVEYRPAGERFTKWIGRPFRAARGFLNGDRQ